MESAQEYPISELSLLFPEMSQQEFPRLVASIRQEGLRDPITVWRGEVIDGRHRLSACAEARVQPRFEYLDDAADPVQYVLYRNVTRRHLDHSQLAVVAYGISRGSTPGRPAGGAGNCAHVRSFTQGEAAKLLKVSLRLVNHASRRLSPESPAVAELRRVVERGQVRVSDAARVVDQPLEVQRQAKTLAGALRRFQREMLRREEAAAREEHLSQPLDDTTTLHVATVSGMTGLVVRDSIDAVITHPPHTEEALTLLSDLAAFAAHALRTTGVMVVVGSSVALPRMLQRLQHERTGGSASSTSCSTDRRNGPAFLLGSSCTGGPCWSTGRWVSARRAWMA